MSRREDLAERSTDYALDHGLIGLSLRPLAAELDTSDRMLIYHVGTKDALVASVLATSNGRSVQTIRALEPSISLRDAVLDLWKASTSPAMQRCQRIYVEAAALGLFGREPYASSVRESNALWLGAMTDHLRASGADEARAPRLAVLADATFNGLLLDNPLDDVADAQRTVDDLAQALADLAA